MPNAVRQTAFTRLNLATLWSEFVYDRGRSYSTLQTQRRGFLRYVAKQCSDPDRVMNEIKFCRDCQSPERLSRAVATDSRQYACASCATAYRECAGCSVRRRRYYFYSTTEGYDVCHVCVNGARFSYCDECGAYYRASNRADHRHPHQECCDSPAKQFTIPNNGGTSLANETRIKITLPAGEISAEGLEQISRQIRYESRYVDDRLERVNWSNLSWGLEELGKEWQTKQGNYAKRLSRLAYKKHGIKIPPQVMTTVGNIARDHSNAVDYSIETTRELNLPAQDFCHGESCWWTSYSESRCAFKTNGGFAIRTFGDRKRPTGRAWVLPIRKLEDSFPRIVPTFETQSPDGYIVFNGYGELNGYKPARILSHMTGMTYRKISFACSPMYVNNETAYLVAPEEIAEPYTDGDIDMDLRQHADLFNQESKELISA